MAAIAQELRVRGHRTTLVGIADGEVIARKRGFDFERVGANTHPSGYFAEVERLCGLVRGVRGYADLRRVVIYDTEMYCREVPAKLRAVGADFVICDQSEPAGALIAYHLHLPFVSIAAALPFNREPNVPPLAFAWSYGSTRWHRWRNAAGTYFLDLFLKPYVEATRKIARDWNLPIGDDPHDYMSGLAQISQMIPSLDMPRLELSGCFHYCGPLRLTPQSWSHEAVVRDPDRAFASLGSMQGHRLDLFEAIARAAKTNGLDLVLAHGGKLGPEGVERLSRSAEVHSLLDQTDIMARVGVAVLHGGLNTVLDAAAAGVPSVIVPIGFEQAAIAARVQRAGAGRVCPMWRARRGRLDALLSEVRANPSYAIAAGRLRDEIAGAGGTRRAADIIEEVLRTGRPVLSAEGKKRRADRQATMGRGEDAAAA